MRKVKIKDLCSFLPKSKIKAGEGLEKGKYIFFTSSDLKTMCLNEYLFDEEAVILGTGGKPSCNYFSGKFAVSTDNFVLRSDKINIKYLYYFLRNNNLSVLEHGFHGAGLKHISKDYVNDIEVPVVDECYQLNIIKNLDLINQNIDFCKNQLIKYDELVKSQFIEMFGNCNKNGSIADVTSEIKRGQWGEEPILDEPNYKVIKTNNMEYDGTLDLSEVVLRNINKDKFEKNKLEYGDILVEKCGGTKTHSVGYSCLFLDSDDYVANNFIMVLTPNKMRINPYFLQYQLRYMYEACNFSDCFNKTTGIQNLKVDLYKNKRICIPNMELQNKFADFVQQIDKSKYFRGVSYAIC